MKTLEYNGIIYEIEKSENTAPLIRRNYKNARQLLLLIKKDTRLRYTALQFKDGTISQPTPIAPYQPY